MAKLADALALGASGEIHMGSSPFTRTKNKEYHISDILFLS